MRKAVSIKIVLSVLISIISLNSLAQTSADVEKKVCDIVKKYESAKGIRSMTFVKGEGLEIVKMMLRKDFGKSAIKGVTRITVIEYSEASEEICLALRKNLDVFLSVLKEYDLTKEEKFADNDYIRCLASASETKTLTDMVIAIEKDKSKVIVYLSGVITI